MGNNVESEKNVFLCSFIDTSDIPFAMKLYFKLLVAKAGTINVPGMFV